MAKPKSFLDIFEAAYGSPISELSDLFAAMLPDPFNFNFEPLVESYLDWSEEYRPPRIAPHETRPLVLPGLGARQIPFVGTAVRPDSLGGLLQFGNRDAASAATLQHMLYCHQILVADSIGYRLAAIQQGVRNPFAYDVQAEYMQLLREVETISSISALIQSGLVHIYPNMSYRADFQLFDRVCELTSADLASLIREHQPEYDDELVEAAFGHPRIQIENGPLTGRDVVRLAEYYALPEAETLWTLMKVLAYDPSLDVYLPTRRHRIALEAYIAKALPLLRDVGLLDQSRARGSIGNQRHFPTLTRLEIPRLATLNTKDLLAIRRHGHFLEWRRVISEGMAAFEVQLESTGLISDAMGALRDRVSSTGHALQSEVHRSRFLTSMTNGSVSVAIGAITGFTGAAVTDDPAAVLAAIGAAGAGAGALWNWLAGRPRPGQRALIRHTLLFEPIEAQA
jgi:hypothetical protein